MLNLSPEFGNIAEAIHLISKNLPCNYVLVLKEQPFCYAVRSNSFYKQMLQIGNVYIANSEIDSQEWINASDIVATITGTVGVEAVYSNKPVISFGMHQAINELPSVFQVSNFSEVERSIKNITSGYIGHEVLLLSKISLRNAQLNASFNLEEYKDQIKSSLLSINSAKIIVDRLMSEYGNKFE